MLGASAAATLNALKELAGIDHSLHIIEPEAIKPIQDLKTNYLKSKNPRLHTDEVLIALSLSSLTLPEAKKAMDCLPLLKNCEIHSSVLLAAVDERIFKKLGLRLTSEPKYETNKKFQG